MKPLHYLIALLIFALICALAWGTCERDKPTKIEAEKARAQIKANSDTIRSNETKIDSVWLDLLNQAVKANEKSQADIASLKEINKRLLTAINQRPNENTTNPADSTLVRFGYITRP